MSTTPAKVDAADTLTLSNSVCPSTSRSELISTAALNVETPVTSKVSEIRVISKLVTPSTSKSVSKSTLPVTVSAPPTVAPTPTTRVDPSNVKFASSSNSPPAPAMTTLLSVRSAIAAVSALNESIFAIPLM